MYRSVQYGVMSWHIETVSGWSLIGAALQLAGFFWLGRYYLRQVAVRGARAGRWLRNWLRLGPPSQRVAIGRLEMTIGAVGIAAVGSVGPITIEERLARLEERYRAVRREVDSQGEAIKVGMERLDVTDTRLSDMDSELRLRLDRLEGIRPTWREVSAASAVVAGTILGALA